MKFVTSLVLLLGISLAIHAAEETNKVVRLSGKVVDSGGQPVEGAEVNFLQFQLPHTGEMESRQKTTTDALGAFQLSLSNVFGQVVVRKKGLAPGWRQWNPYPEFKDKDEKFVLTPPGAVAGIVVDQDGKPVGDAKVVLKQAMAELAHENGRRSYYSILGNALGADFATRSDKDGHFRLEGLPTNTLVDLDLQVEGKVLREKQRDHGGPDTMMCRVGQTNVSLVLEPAGSIEGKLIVPENSGALATAKLSLQATQNGSRRYDKPIEPNSNGIFRFSKVAPGTYHIRAIFGTNNISDWVAEPVAVTVASGQTNAGVNVTAIKGGFLEARVISSTDRKPVNDANVNVFRPDYQGGGNSDSNGLVVLRLPPGEYQVSSYKQEANTKQIAATIKEGLTNQLELEMVPPPLITGVVRDTNGVPVAGASVQILPDLKEVQTDSNGRYEMKWNPRMYGGQERSYAMMIRDVPRNLAAAHDVEESTRTLDLTLEPGLTIAGRVDDVDGKPLTNAVVHIVFWTGNMGAWLDQAQPPKLNADGTFEVSALPRGRRYSAGVSAPGHGSGNSPIVDEDGSTNRMELAPFVLRVADKKLAGRVVDADEKPVPGARVYTYGDGQPQANVQTDKDGYFTIDQVCEGTVNVNASAQSSYGNARVEAGDTNVVVTLGTQSGMARSAPPRAALTGKPLPDLTSFGLTNAATGKRVLVCLFDVEQRPSRRFVKLLIEKHDMLQKKDVVTLGVQAAVLTPEALKEWTDANPVPFPLGSVKGKNEKAKWVSEAQSLPWLILTDPQGRVSAEGFALDELESKLN